MIKKAFSKDSQGKTGWREGVGVEPTQGFLRPHTGFEDQKAHRDLYPPAFKPGYVYRPAVLSGRCCQKTPRWLAHIYAKTA
jgi:hypothetical protein